LTFISIIAAAVSFSEHSETARSAAIHRGSSVSTILVSHTVMLDRRRSLGSSSFNAKFTRTAASKAA
jgi:hypothetical protein